MRRREVTPRRGRKERVCALGGNGAAASVGWGAQNAQRGDRLANRSVEWRVSGRRAGQ